MRGTAVDHITDLLGGRRVMPVLVVPDVAMAAPLARALAAGGLKAVEVTLRTPQALEAVSIMAAAAPSLAVGVGTVRTPAQAAASKAAGARFLVSPGTTPDLAAAMKATGLPCLPGAASASEVMARVADGFETLKFFPAEQAGGVAALKAFDGPFADVAFCPTGGIGLDKIESYLALPNVICVGGSWIATEPLMRAGDWARIEENAARAAGF